MTSIKMLFEVLLLIMSTATPSYAQSERTFINGQFLRGIPEACYQLTMFNTSGLELAVDSIQEGTFNPQEKLKLVKNEVDSRIQSILQRFKIPISRCTTESYPKMANIRMFVDLKRGKNTNMARYAMSTQILDFVKSVHIEMIAKVSLYSIEYQSVDFPADKTASRIASDLSRQIFKAAGEFREQNN